MRTSASTTFPPASSATPRHSRLPPRRDAAPQAPVCRSILALLDIQRCRAEGQTMPERVASLHVLVIATVLAATPDVPVG
jgi:hypothetical protein